MPWDIKKQDGKFCVYKKTTGKIMHCYDNEGDAKDYLAALYANASEKDLKELLVVEKQDDGRYHIVAVSTAALKDREDETFTTDAIDYDIKLAKSSGEYPEFRLFHQRGLGFGKVTKMSRVGIFAVDEGYSYDDPFSIEVCEKMLVPNPGKWRASRGFFIIETSGGCPNCGTKLLVGTKQMKAGFRCPNCESTYLDYKGVLNDVHFRKVKTFDVTVTDQPAVPWTGVAAFRNTISEDLMTRKELKQRLIKAGISEEAVDARLLFLTDAQLKEFTDIPFAEVLKEFEDDEDDEEDEYKKKRDEDDDEDTVDVEDVVKEFRNVVRDVVRKEMLDVLNGFEINVTDIGEFEVDMKELGDIKGMKEAIEAVAAEVEDLTEAISVLSRSEEERLKEIASDMSRSSKLRIRRYKQTPPEEDEDEDEDDEEAMEKEFSVSIMGSDGKRAKTMTEWLTSGDN